MLLLVDAGNTRIKWALVPAAGLDTATLGRWADSGSVGSSQVASLVQEWRAHSVARVLISNVAGSAVRDKLEQAILLAFGPVAAEWFASVPVLAGIRNCYRQPAQLGCDRFASVIGAHALFPDQPLIVATCGTATTIDAVTAEGVFIGGMILPGLSLMAASLAMNTAQLPQIRHSQENQLFTDNTEDAIDSGCKAAQAGAIERALAAHPQHDANVGCILAGGAAHLISPSLFVTHSTVNNLVLIGLQAVAISQIKSGPSC